MVVILGVTSLDLWHELLADHAGFAKMLHVWCHMTREMGRGPIVL